MFKCLDCGATFPEPNVEQIEDPREYWGAACSETFVEYHCPYCGSDDVDEQNDCIICGEATEDGFCKQCHVNLQHDLEQIQKDYKLTWGQLQDFIAEHFGW